MLYKAYKLTLLFTLIFFTRSFAQGDFEWTPERKLTLADFQSAATNLSADVITMQPASRIDFAYQMSNYEFMFTKNFNNKVVCKFLSEAASIQAPDSVMALQLLALAQYEFDLSELYARKLRKRIFDEKGAFSNAQFFIPISAELDKERSVSFNNTVNDTHFGKDTKKLQELHATVLEEIAALSDFCKDCKPPRRKKKG
jgi:hypothetical protein